MAASDLYGLTPGWGLQAFPALALQRLPQLLGIFLAKVTALFQQWWAIRHPTPPVDEDLRVTDPCLFIPVEPPDPVIVPVNQPALFHNPAIKYRCTSNENVNTATMSSEENL